MIFSPCRGRIDSIQNKEGYVSVCMTVENGDFLHAPTSGLLRVMEKEWSTLCSIKNKKNHIIVIRKNKRRSNGPCSRHIRQIGLGDSMGVPIATFCPIEIRMLNKNLLLTCSKNEMMELSGMIGLYIRNPHWIKK